MKAAACSCRVTPDRQAWGGLHRPEGHPGLPSGPIPDGGHRRQHEAPDQTGQAARAAPPDAGGPRPPGIVPVGRLADIDPVFSAVIAMPLAHFVQYYARARKKCGPSSAGTGLVGWNDPDNDGSAAIHAELDRFRAMAGEASPLTPLPLPEK